MYSGSLYVQCREGIGAVNEQRTLQFFRLGLWLLVLSTSASVLSYTRWAVNSIWASAPLMIAGMLFLLKAVSIDWRASFSQLKRSHRLALTLLITWGVVTFIRGGLDFQWRTIRDLFGMQNYGWAWMIPPMMLLGMNLTILRRLLREIVRQTGLGLVLFVACRLPPLLLRTDFHLTWGSAYALLFWHYLPKWVRLIALVGAFINIFSAIMANSRNKVMGMGLLVISAVFIEMRRRHPTYVTRRLGILTLCGLVFGVVYCVSICDQLPIVGETTAAKIQSFKNDLTYERLLSSRINKDKDYSLYAEFFDNMSTYDLLFGRGAMGYYEVVRSETRVVKRRYTFECGYLHTVLKAGAVMLILMLGLAVPAIWLGLFCSRNWFVRGFAFIVLMWLVEMVPFGLPGANARYLLFWMAIGACLNSRLRMLTDHELEEVFLGWPHSLARSRSAQWTVGTAAQPYSPAGDSSWLPRSYSEMYRSPGI